MFIGLAHKYLHTCALSDLFIDIAVLHYLILKRPCCGQCYQTRKAWPHVCRYIYQVRIVVIISMKLTELMATQLTGLPGQFRKPFLLMVKMNEHN